ncbi:hypothetical protein NGRA_0993 [Nosema granulosis]|uniref:Uncharacterized protein n=1 Tax=Nosema granulosis TaxID=83296 RepID=A0A9P6H2I3_9MICR|nr:hypothetical protein NGRA_0993 [Nosema granulosis]
MLIYFLAVALAELNEKGYLYSVGQEQFLSVENNKVRTVAKSKMPTKFEIETRGGDSSYMLRIYPDPRNGDNVMDKDWWYNDHKLIFYPQNDWQSQHFVFSMLPKNMLKIVVKERCAEVKPDGSVKASLCKNHNDNKSQYFRWIREEDRRIVQAFVRKHGGRAGRDGFGGDEDLGYRREGFRGSGRGRGGRYDEFDDDRGRGSKPCYDEEECQDTGDKYSQQGYTDDDFFRSRGNRGGRRGRDSFDGGRSYQDDDCDSADELCDIDNYSGYRSSGRGRGGGRGPSRGKSKRSPLAEAMCSDEIDEIGKIICEINRMPNLVI